MLESQVFMCLFRVLFIESIVCKVVGGLNLDPRRNTLAEHVASPSDVQIVPDTSV